jgi:hypothetical protein
VARISYGATPFAQAMAYLGQRAAEIISAGEPAIA